MSDCELCGGEGLYREYMDGFTHLSLQYGKEEGDDEPHWFMRFVMKADGKYYGENFPAAFCPLCGEELPDER